MKTAVIVLNYNDYETTSEYIENIKDYSAIDKIVIVDNNSPLNDYEKLINYRSSKVEVIKSDKNGGYAYGNNYGVRYLNKKYGANYFDTFIISNPDVYVENDVIEKCNKVLHSERSYAVVAPRMHFENKIARRSAWKKRSFFIDIANSTRVNELILRKVMRMGEYTKKDFEKEKLKVFAIAGSFFLIKSQVFNSINGFDENTFLFFEEDILSSKLESKGYDVLSLNNYKFIHYDSKTIGKLMNMFKKQKILFKSRKYYHKNYNHVSNTLLHVFDILYIFRCIELVIELPILKLQKAIKGSR
ncbi:MAG: glycosyltransferase family 2 protein [Clostridia bacterium]|nr:glycosyltransferase family 2 protein [Clostridia bacterium]